MSLQNDVISALLGTCDVLIRFFLFNKCDRI